MLKTLYRHDRRLLLALLTIVVLLNVPFGNYVLYPFKLFSTWVHEMGHGLAALLVGSTIDNLKVFSDGSGLATTLSPPGGGGRISRAIIASAGYLGTSIVGAMLLSLRRFRRIERIGTIGFGLLMALSAILWVRNGFGFFAILVIAAALILAGLKLKQGGASFLFALLAATCSLNALTSIQTLFGGTRQVGGEVVEHTDAHTVAAQLFLPYWFWAGRWLITSVGLLFVGLRLGLRATPEAEANSEA
ncbi:MAG: M50 family metallopeptidase [Myxococcota bacterium]|nr:M50 family metallopeptidase [Myxococcota bacterium]